jgi:restriction system protein
MARRREPAILDGALRLFVLAPIWVGPVVAAAMFGVFWAFPLVISDKSPMKLFAPICHLLAWMFGGMLMAAWVVSLVVKLANRALFARHKVRPAETMGDLSWREFERLVTEAYRREGYLAEGVGNASGDGGMDIVLRGHGQRVIVQCKHWKAFKVGVGPVRELLGVVTSERAGRGVLVTSGRFTEEAVRFGERNSNLELMDGRRWAGFIEAVR